MGKRKYLDTEKFQILLKDFLTIPTWTKNKKEKYRALTYFLSQHEVLIKNVKRRSKHNYCAFTNSFTIFEVPKDQLGKLFDYRGEWVLIFCSSTGSYDYAWGGYLNEIYRIKGSFSNKELETIKIKFNDYFVLK